MCVNMKKEAMDKEAILKSFRCSNASGAKTKGDRLLRKRCLDFFKKIFMLMYYMYNCMSVAKYHV